MLFCMLEHVWHGSLVFSPSERVRDWKVKVGRLGCVNMVRLLYMLSYERSAGSEKATVCVDSVCSSGLWYMCFFDCVSTTWTNFVVCLERIRMTDCC